MEGRAPKQTNGGGRGALGHAKDDRAGLQLGRPVLSAVNLLSAQRRGDLCESDRHLRRVSHVGWQAHCDGFTKAAPVSGEAK